MGVSVNQSVQQQELFNNLTVLHSAIDNFSHGSLHHCQNCPLSNGRPMPPVYLSFRNSSSRRLREKRSLCSWWFHQNYVSSLDYMGFVVQSFQSKQKVNADTFTMEELSLSTLKTVSTPTGNALAKTAIEALGKLPASDRSVKIFNNQTTNFTPSGNFQVCVCDQSNGFVVIGFGFL